MFAKKLLNMYLSNELIEQYNIKKTRGKQKELIQLTGIKQPHMALVLQGRHPVNKHRAEIIKNFIENMR